MRYLLSLLFWFGLVLTSYAQTVLTQDVVLSGSDSLRWTGTVDGRGYRLYTAADWTGSIDVQDCTIINLGDSVQPSLTIDGTGTVKLLRVSFSRCNRIIVNGAATPTHITHCSYEADCVNSIEQNGITGDNEPAFHVAGRGGVFSHNIVLRGWVEFGMGWTAEHNVIAGVRGGIRGGGDTIARYNYTFADITVSENVPWWGDVFNIAGGFADFSHNISDCGHWIWRLISGNFHHNLIVHGHAQAWVQIGSATIHHNIFTHRDLHQDRWNDSYDPTCIAFVHQPWSTDNFAVYNNVFDGRGTDTDHPAASWGAYVVDGSTMPKFAGNVLYNVPNSWQGNILDTSGNFIGDPGFQNPPAEFPYTATDFISGGVTVREVLEMYRVAYHY